MVGGSRPKKSQCSSPSSNAGEDPCYSSVRQEEFPLTQPFCSTQIFGDWMRAIHIGKGYLRYSAYRFKC